MKALFPLLLAFFLWVPAPADAEPCGEIPQEGQCFGKIKKYCNAQGDLVTQEPCESCCGWKGNKYNCMPCAPAGECLDECNDPSVFGCNLQNTHEWFCQFDVNGCVRRIFTKCPEGKICDESGTHKCTPIEQVNLCGAVPIDTGICDGSVHKVCVNNKVESTDCGELGQVCLPQGCTSDCPVDCLAGESGCLPAGKQWTCTEDPSTGCWVKAEKHCGIKQCIDGKCQFPPEKSEEEVVEEAEPAPPVVEEEPEEDSGGGGGCILTNPPTGFAVGSLLLLATLLGFVLFARITQKKP